jgi:CheY-like chemotaxis protein
MSPLVLLVDDEDTLRSTQARYLRRHGYEVREASSGPDALAAAALAPLPDVIVMDVMLPGMDGVAVTVNLRASQATRGIPVIASTGAILRELPFEAAGFASVLLKPYDLRELLQAIGGAIGSTRARDVGHKQDRLAG